MSSDENAMLEYLRDPGGFITLYIAFAAVFCIGYGLYALANKGAVLEFLVTMFCAAACIFAFLAPSMSYKHMIKTLKENNTYDNAVSDFAEAKSFLDDNIRLGKRYVFGKKLCTVMNYGDIDRVYQFVRRTNGIESSRSLRAVDSAGMEKTLCNLKKHNKSRPKMNEELDEALIEVINFILRRNPTIDVGYKA